MTWTRVIGALSAVSIALTPSASHDSQRANAASALRFRAEEIAADFGIGYAVTTGDVNGDGRTDVVAINATDLVWFEAPAWQKHVILTGVTPRDNVCLALHDIDRDGRLDVALGAGWQPTNTVGGGTLHWVAQGGPGADAGRRRASGALASPAEASAEAGWQIHSIAEEPTLHRIRWADVDGDRMRELVVTPLHGRGTKAPEWQGQGARVLVFRPPANPRRDPWPVEIADDTLHILHNFIAANLDDDPQEEILTASREGVNVLKRRAGGNWSRMPIGEGSPGEVRLGRVAGRRMLATIEPWHGRSVVIYVQRPGIWSRTVIESELTGGHALGWADFDGDGSEELAVGWRDVKPGVAIYAVDREGALRSKLIVDDRGMAAEDLAIADLNGDKQPDIVVSGRATRNIKIYWNDTQRPARPR